MKKIYLKILLILIVCFVVLHLSNKKQQLHIYLDPATTPTLLQMVDFIQKPTKDFKIISWNRFDHYIKNKENFQNTFFIPVDKNYISEDSYFFFQIKKLLKKNPNTDIHLHFNLTHPTAYHFLVNHPLIKNKIKSVHIYEDASGHIFRDENVSFFPKSPIPKPFFYHWGNPNKICAPDFSSDSCKNFNTIKLYTIPIQIDFKKLTKSLSESDKKKIFDLAGFDYEKMNQLLNKKNPHFYILGYNWRSSFYGAQLSALKELCNSKTNKNITWFYKNHPNNKFVPTHRTLQHLCPNIEPIDAHIPFELLLIGGFKNIKVSGYSSSLFFNQEKENISNYMLRENDPYIQILTKAKSLKEDQIWDIPKQKVSLEKSNIFELVYDQKNERAKWYLKIDEHTLLDIFNDHTIKILNQTPTTLLIEDENKKETYKKDEFYRYILTE